MAFFSRKGRVFKKKWVLAAKTSQNGGPLKAKVCPPIIGEQPGKIFHQSNQIYLKYWTIFLKPISTTLLKGPQYYMHYYSPAIPENCHAFAVF